MFIPRSRRRPKKLRALGLDEPLRHENHAKPMTRRELLAQGWIAGTATVVAPTILSTMIAQQANAALSDDIQILLNAANCNVQNGAGKVPFICFDLAGGANLAGSNCLVGADQNWANLLTTAGYSKLGIGGASVPNAAGTPGTNFIDTRLGIAFHSLSAMLRGIAMRASADTMSRVNGFTIPARSENDTSNNMHNPMYGIAKAGARGSLLTLIGTQNSESGGNSMAPITMIDPTIRPTKIDRSSDCVGLVDTGQLGTLLPSQADTVAVMESIERISEMKLGTQTPAPAIMPVDTLLDTPANPTGDADAKKLVKCAYVKTANQAQNFNSSDVLNPRSTADVIAGAATPAAIFTTAELNASSEFERTVSVMKLVVNGYAGAGTVSLGGYDYHTGERGTGEMRDERAGQCIGAVLEYAARKSKPVMIYVFSDGSLSSNGALDNTMAGAGKPQWTGDNQGTACSLVLIYNPTGIPTITRPQIGSFSAAGDVVTSSSPAANSVANLVHLVIGNWMNLHANDLGNFATLFPNSGLSAAQLAANVVTTPII